MQQSDWFSSAAQIPSPHITVRFPSSDEVFESVQSVSELEMQDAGLFFVRRLYPEIFDTKLIGRRVIEKLLKYSLPVALGGVFGALIYWVDRLFVGYYRTETETGIYQAASQMSLIFAVVICDHTFWSTPVRETVPVLPR